ncbi:hypothetical protein DMENIID0001_171420 [Sergentomyia squamirostris]
MRGGRGFSRGGYSRGGGSSSYRGHSNPSSYHRGGGSGRGGGGYNGSGGGGRYGGGNDSYSSYASSSHSSSRYSDNRSYGNRDHSSGGGGPFKRNANHRDFRSPDRKRMRNDHQGMPPPRRSHDSYGSSSDRSYGGSYDKSSHYRGRGSAGRQSHDQPPRVGGGSTRGGGGSSFRNSGRHDNNMISPSHRHHRNDMGAPPATRGPIRPNTGYRGRAAISGRGMRPRGGGVAVARRRLEMKIRSREIMQQKLARIRSSIRKRPVHRTESSAGKKEIEEKKIKSEPANDDDDKKSTKDDSSSEVKVKSEPDEDAAGEEKEKSSTERTETDSPKKDSEDVSPIKGRFPGRSFIKLTCIHCSSKFLTFKAYSRHLYGGAHRSTMYRLARDLKERLASMRQDQRTEQRELEKDLTEDELNTRPHYCLLCRLSYRQEKTAHQNADSHKAMRRFLLPYCGTCKLSFKSPMIYENHRCSLEHIKLKARIDAAKNHVENSDDELDLENFMTVDSVGSVDDDPVIGDLPEDVGGEKIKREVNLGSDHVKKVETMYCDLCRVYMSHRDEPEKALKVHCGARSHVRAYMRYQDDKTLREEAERERQRRKEEEEEAEKRAAAEGENKEKPDGEENGEEEDDTNKAEEQKNVDNEEEEDDEEVGEDKLWADVDKDLGDLLREVGPEDEQEDDDDDSHINNERYDRFRKTSEKDEEEKSGENATESDAIKENGAVSTT